jgi:glyoxylase-like metal-dependent hydrolase (beta-lactamase superfamily II)
MGRTHRLVDALPAQAVEAAFKPVADGVYAYIGDTDGRTCDNEGVNANIGLIVTPAGAVLIDSGSTFQVAGKIEAAAQKVTTQPIKRVINTGGQDHRWLGNGYFSAKGIETIAHVDAQADMKARALAHGGFECLEGATGGYRAGLSHPLCRRSRHPPGTRRHSD